MVYDKVVEGSVIALVAEMFGIEDEDEIDYITQTVVEILANDNVEESGNDMADLLTDMSPRQLMVVGSVVGAVVKGWLMEEKEEELVEGYN